MVKINIGGIIVSINGGNNIINELECMWDGYVVSETEKEIIYVEIVNTNFKPEQKKTELGDLSFSLFSGYVYVYFDSATLSGKIYMADETPVKKDAIETALLYIVSQYSTLFGMLIMHGALISNERVCFGIIGDSGAGKTTMCKIFSSGSTVLAEDMFALQCRDKFSINATTIPIEQKHFWFGQPVHKTIDFMLVLHDGETGIEKELDMFNRIRTLMKHQFCRRLIDEKLYENALTNCVEKAARSVPVIQLEFDPQKFYQKDRKYVNELIHKVDEISNLYQSKNCKTGMQQGKMQVPDNIHFRKGIKSGSIEIWRGDNGQLLGLDSDDAAMFLSVFAGDDGEYEHNSKSILRMMELGILKTREEANEICAY